MTRTDHIVEAVRREAYRRKSTLDNEPYLSSVRFFVKIDGQGKVKRVQMATETEIDCYPGVDKGN